MSAVKCPVPAVRNQCTICLTRCRCMTDLQHITITAITMPPFKQLMTALLVTSTLNNERIIALHVLERHACTMFILLLRNSRVELHRCYTCR